MSFMSNKEYEYRNLISMKTHSKRNPIYYRITSGVKFKPSKVWVSKWREDGLPLVRGIIKYEYNSCNEVVSIVKEEELIYQANYDENCLISFETLFARYSVDNEIIKNKNFYPRNKIGTKTIYKYDIEKRLIMKQKEYL